MKPACRHLAAAALGLSLALPAAALEFQFGLAGFSGGGSLSGSFTGQDLDGNGIISVFDPGSEITSFSLTFRGDALVPDFQAGLADLQSLVYVVGGNALLGDDMLPAPEALWVARGDVQLLAGLGAYGEVGAIVTDLGRDLTSIALQPVAVVPELPSGWLLAVGLVALRAVGRRRPRMRADQPLEPAREAP